MISSGVVTARPLFHSRMIFSENRRTLFGIMPSDSRMIFSENRRTLFGIMPSDSRMIFSENRRTLFGIMLWKLTASRARPEVRAAPRTQIAVSHRSFLDNLLSSTMPA
jgi:hypothetical protein